MDNFKILYKQNNLKDEYPITRARWQVIYDIKDDIHPIQIHISASCTKAKIECELCPTLDIAPILNLTFKLKQFNPNEIQQGFKTHCVSDLDAWIILNEPKTASNVSLEILDNCGSKLQVLIKGDFNDCTSSFEFTTWIKNFIPEERYDAMTLIGDILAESDEFNVNTKTVQCIADYYRMLVNEFTNKYSHSIFYSHCEEYKNDYYKPTFLSNVIISLLYDLNYIQLIKNDEDLDKLVNHYPKKEVKYIYLNKDENKYALIIPTKYTQSDLNVIEKAFNVSISEELIDSKKKKFNKKPIYISAIVSLGVVVSVVIAKLKKR